MNSLREFCYEKLNKDPQDLMKSNRMWDKRAKEFSKSSKKNEVNYVDYLKHFVDLKGASVLDVGCGTSDYLKILLDESAVAEGLEPSKEMRKIGLNYLKDNGYPNVTIYHSSLQDFEVSKKYEYVFIANSPVISYYENYEKILSLAEKGILIGSWLDSSDSLLDEIAGRLHIVPKKHGGKDILYFFNLLLEDGYKANFQTVTRQSSVMENALNSLERYTSWFYGPDYNHDDLNRVKDIIMELSNEKGEVLIHKEATNAIVFAEK